MKTVNTRSTDHPINDIFLKRYSPRAFSGESLTKDEIMTIFEAARWAPSARNFQSWRFVYCTRESAQFATFLSFLTESNQVWCKNAGMLVVVLSKSIRDDGTPQKNHELEAGLATENLLLQATELNLASHPMGGILPEIIKETLQIGNEYTSHIMIAVGKAGKIEDLPEKLQAREAPSQRKLLDEIVFEEKFIA